MAPAWLEKFIKREDATPDTRRTSEKPALEMRYTSVDTHHRTLGVAGESVPRYEVTRQSVLGAWGSKCHVTAPIDGGAEVAKLDFHSVPRAYMEIVLTRGASHNNNNKTIEVGIAKLQYDAGGALGVLHWKGTGMKPYGAASWELRDDKRLIMSVDIDDSQANGVVSLWVEGLQPEVVEELVMVAVAQIEHYKQTLRNSKTAGVGAAASLVAA
ncbi:hypothetical protein MN608_11648 [Microdochium nivale]|nr:hypothetical protein MN608_11648 [Microdochium nivale]